LCLKRVFVGKKVLGFSPDLYSKNTLKPPARIFAQKRIPFYRNEIYWMGREGKEPVSLIGHAMAKWEKILLSQTNLVGKWEESQQKCP
jgi:hypothetical protein